MPTREATPPSPKPADTSKPLSLKEQIQKDISDLEKSLTEMQRAVTQQKGALEYANKLLEEVQANEVEEERFNEDLEDVIFEMDRRAGATQYAKMLLDRRKADPTPSEPPAPPMKRRPSSELPQNGAPKGDSTLVAPVGSDDSEDDDLAAPV